MAVSSDLIRGHTDTIILNFLSRGDSYGYEITRAIQGASDGLFDIKDATIYTAFRRLEQDGLILTYWGDGTGGARRRYYSITDTGKDYLSEKVAEWQKVKSIINNLIGG